MRQARRNLIAISRNAVQFTFLWGHSDHNRQMRLTGDDAKAASGCRQLGKVVVHNRGSDSGSSRSSRSRCSFFFFFFFFHSAVTDAVIAAIINSMSPPPTNDSNDAKEEAEKMITREFTSTRTLDLIKAPHLKQTDTTACLLE